MTITTSTEYAVRDARGWYVERRLGTPEYALLRADGLGKQLHDLSGCKPPFRAVKIKTTITIEELTP